jgi:acetyl-CoA carboxylase biotin carboxyl carrier protein
MDLHKIKTLLDFVGRSRVSELTVSEAGTTVVIRNPSRAAAGGQEAAALHSEEHSQNEPIVIEDQAQSQLVRTCLTGIVHQSHSPGTAPLVAVGDLVEVGQALCIVEAMKVFTTVPTPFGGVVKRIFFEDGQEVGFGDPLVEIG